MKKSIFLFLIICGYGFLTAQNCWINELHYDDAGGDSDEIVEVIIENPGSFTLSLFEVYLYNGSNGAYYDSEQVDNFLVGDTEGGYIIYYWFPGSIQNGAPDGLALSYDGVLIPGQFISYEGSFLATNGPASGSTSVDMGVSESGVPEGHSLQLAGTGSFYGDFTWQDPAAGTFGSLNNGQTLGSGGNQAPSISNILHDPANPNSTQTVRISAIVVDDVSVASVNCHWGLSDGGPYANTIVMNLASDDSYETSTDIPAQADGTVVYYIVEATDNESETTTSPQQSYAVSDVVIAINEIHADPDPASGDANGDGSVSSSQDEFVEIVNLTDEAIDISFYTLSDGLSVRHEFPKGSILQPQDAIVVFGGGAPSGFDYYDVQTASSGSLGLNNGGDDVILKDSSGTSIVSVTYGSEAGDNQSITRDPDFNGEFVKHSVASGSGGALFSPHRFINGNWFKTVTIWNGSQANKNWDDEDNWSNGTPDADSRVVIPDSINYFPELTGPGPECNSLFLESDVPLVRIDYLNTAGFTIIQRSIDQYYSDDDGFHLLSSPVDGFTIAGSPFEPVSGVDDFYNWHEATNTWQNYFGSQFPDGEFATGKGYLVAYAIQNDGFFYGKTNDTTISKNLSYHPTQGNGWNLLGNPYPSAIDWDLLTKSAGVDGAVYVLRGSDNTYLSWNGSAGDLTDGLIPICNGFFVKAGAPGQHVTIEPADQSGNDAGFLKSSEEGVSETTLEISIHEGDYYNRTYIQFREDATHAFDKEIDAYKLFGSTQKPQLYTSLSDIDYAINCLPYKGASLELPLGYIGTSDSTLIISLSERITPKNRHLEIFLEDKVTGMLTDLLQKDYSFQPSAEGDEKRFMLYFNHATTVDELLYRDFARVNYGSGKLHIQFHETLATPCETQVINMMGQQVLSTNIQHRNTQYIPLVQPAGIYFVVITSGNQYQAFKILIN